jgi:hypothetical protein
MFFLLPSGQVQDSFTLINIEQGPHLVIVNEENKILLRDGVDTYILYFV